jgi:GH25 family lysozyme M1 (1,4-beta-N-acetylmuramidase)
MTRSLWRRHAGRLSLIVAAVNITFFNSVSAAENLQEVFPLRELRNTFRAPALTELKDVAEPLPTPPFALPADATSKGGVFGVDISHWETECDAPCICSIDWKDGIWAQGIRFAYAEATIGAKSIDQTFPGHWKELKPLHDAGSIYRGAFHWLTSADDESGTDQANWFLSHVGPDKDRLPHVLDFEEDFVEVTQDYYDATGSKAECKKQVDGHNSIHLMCDGWYGKKPQEIFSKIVDWVSRVERDDGKAIIYTRKGYWDEKIGPIGLNFIKTHPLWIARYLDPTTFPDPEKPQSTEPPTNKWGMTLLPQGIAYPAGNDYTSRITWQFTAKGTFQKSPWICKGTNRPPRKDPPMDMDWFPSSLTDFKTQFGLP